MDQPEIDIKPSKSDKLAQWITFALVFLYWLAVIVTYSYLPERVPTHFNAAGEVNRQSGKGTIFIIPIIGTFLLILLTGLSKMPHLLTYSITITKENAAKAYLESTRVLRYLNLILQATFLFIVVSIILVATGKQTGLSPWFLPVFIVVIMIPTVYMLFKRYKNREQ